MISAQEDSLKARRRHYAVMVGGSSLSISASNSSLGMLAMRSAVLRSSGDSPASFAAWRRV